MMRILLLALLLCKEALSANPSIDSFKQGICAYLPNISGWCSEEKAQHFIDLVLDVKPKVCVEIGVFYGSSLFPVASALKFLGSGVVIGIDPWNQLECTKNYDPIEDRVHIAWWSQINMEHAYLSCLVMLKNFQLDPYCFLYRNTAEEAAPRIDGIDILYLDGNQSEISNLLDVSLYLPKVVVGGYIWMNNPLCVRAQAAIDLLVKDCDIIKVIENGNCALFKKR